MATNELLVIRTAQRNTLQLAMLDDFRAWMVVHLRRHFREQMEPRSDADLESLIERGIQRAQRHGADRESTFCKYIGLLVALGEDFERDPAYPWAARVLADEALGDGNTRIEVLAIVARQELARSEAAAR